MYVRNRPIEEVIKATHLSRQMTCALHKLDKCVYCEQCQVTLCAICCCGEEHRGHTISQLNKVYTEKRQKIMKALESVDGRIEELNAIGQQVDQDLIDMQY